MKSGIPGLRRTTPLCFVLRRARETGIRLPESVITGPLRSSVTR
jgi:hypothetical protein